MKRPRQLDIPWQYEGEARYISVEMHRFWASFEDASTFLGAVERGPDMLLFFQIDDYVYITDAKTRRIYCWIHKLTMEHSKYNGNLHGDLLEIGVQRYRALQFGEL